MELDVKRARHDLRGRLNALKLCVSAFEVLESRAELLEFLDLIEQGADRTVTALDDLERACENEPSAVSPH
jgi:signal transduction histidine kinase